MIELAIVGAGYWGKNLVRNYASVPGGRLRYVVDTDEGVRARTEAQYPGVKALSDIADVLADPVVEAVVIATPAPSHFSLAKQALEADKHVYVEKPLTLNSGEAETLVNLARKRNRKLMVGHLMEYHSAVNWLKDYMDKGELGEILYMYSQRVNLGIVRSNENALWSLAPHDISIILYLLGQEPQTVRATGQTYLQPGIEDVVFATLHFADGKMAHIHVSWLDPHKNRKLTVVGKSRMVIFDDMAPEKITVFDKGIQSGKATDYASYAEFLSIRQGDIYLPHIPAREPLAVECAHFIDCIANDKTPRSDGLDGLRVVKILEAAQESLRNGGLPVQISPSPKF